MPSPGFRTQRRNLLRLGLGAAAVAAAPLSGLTSAAATRRAGHRTLARNLHFPEGPVALGDGSLLIVEIAKQALTRVDADGQVERLAQLPGGPNGAAIGPDGACYVCNNGGDRFAQVDGVLLPVGPAGDYTGGWIERVDLRSGQAETLYESVGGRRLSAPNDLVFDSSGGFWFTDMGKAGDRSRDHGGVYYARADGSAITEVVYPLQSPNGIGLSADGRTLFVAEFFSGRVIGFEVTGPGELADSAGILPGRLIAAGPGRPVFDSMAIEADGNICVADPIAGQIVCIAPGGEIVEVVPVPASLPTNLCFGGPDLRTAYITLSGNGQLIAMDWPRAGLRLR